MTALISTQLSSARLSPNDFSAQLSSAQHYSAQLSTPVSLNGIYETKLDGGGDLKTMRATGKFSALKMRTTCCEVMS